MKMDFETTLGGYVEDIFSVYIPLLIRLPALRGDENFMQIETKTKGESGIDDVVTNADLWMQSELKKHIQHLYPNWQFWGEEHEASGKEVVTTKGLLFVVDPIEGTNNFRFFKDAFWGSVVSVVDITTQDPLIGIIAQPIKKMLFVGIKGEGAFKIYYDDSGSVTKIESLTNSPEYDFFTYNNSPHFASHLVAQVKNFFRLGKIQPDRPELDQLELSRKEVLLPYKDNHVKFVDVECGAIEPMLFRGVIMFKTNIEMAAVFVVAKEIDAIVTDANGKGWSMDLDSLIFARTKEDWEYLKSLYDRTK